MPYDREPLPQNTPVQAPGPIAWEHLESSFVRRLVGTLASAFAPLTTMQAISVGGVLPALRFALLTSLPFLLAWAIPPFTHTMQFSYSFGFTLLEPNAPQLEIAWDVARAMLIGLGLGLFSLVAWATPFASLLHAFGKPPVPGIDARVAAWRMALYRAWLVPCGLTLLSLVAWAQPKDAHAAVVELSVLTFHQLPRLVLVVHCFSAARYFGIMGLSSVLVAGVPLMVEMAAGSLVDLGAQKLLPTPPGGNP